MHFVKVIFWKIFLQMGGPQSLWPRPKAAAVGPGPARAQKTNPKSIFLGISGISEASDRPVWIRLAELVCLLIFRGLRNPPGTKIDKE